MTNKTTIDFDITILNLTRFEYGKQLYRETFYIGNIKHFTAEQEYYIRQSVPLHKFGLSFIDFSYVIWNMYRSSNECTQEIKRLGLTLFVDVDKFAWYVVKRLWCEIKQKGLTANIQSHIDTYINNPEYLTGLVKWRYDINNVYKAPWVNHNDFYNFFQLYIYGDVYNKFHQPVNKFGCIFPYFTERKNDMILFMEYDEIYKENVYLYKIKDTINEFFNG